MQELSAFVEGPLLWAAWIIFVGGSLARLIMFFSLAKKRDKMVVYGFFSFKAMVTTWLRYLLPVNQTVRKSPAFMILAYIFHYCLLAVPIFAIAHLTEWESGDLKWDLSAINIIPDAWIPYLTWVVIAIGFIFFIRRLVAPEVRIISEPSDFLILVVVLLPFITGFLTSHTKLLGDYGRLLHVLSGELWLILIPLTKLSHMFLFFTSRMVLGNEWNRRGYIV
jgi:nitrate reductase gamma subunit